VSAFEGFALADCLVCFDALLSEADYFAVFAAWAFG
jgi:hypothetical protein